jgi:2-phosphosulfolactate phosphatase
MNSKLEIRRTSLDACHEATGVVVVIDVLRAFTTAAFALGRRAAEILLVSTVEEAFELRERYPDCLLVGEVGGLPIPGFDLPNSPTALANMDLASKRLIQRTTAGTQGVVRAAKADQLFAASLCVGAATASCLAARSPDSITFVETGVRAKGGGEEDIAGADYIAHRLLGTPPNLSDIRSRVLNSRAAQKFTGAEDSDFPRSDLEHALLIDRFDFAMEVVRRDGLFVLKPAK